MPAPSARCQGLKEVENASASLLAERSLSDDIVVFGEVGLGGEVRRVTNVVHRVKEAKKLGFKHAIAPQSKDGGSFILPVQDLRDSLNNYLTKK